MSYGAFARLEAGVEGLIHASEMVLEPNQTPREILYEGQELKAAYFACRSVPSANGVEFAPTKYRMTFAVNQ